MVTKQDIFDFLNSLGIDHSRTVLVHTSMKALGEVEGGCDGLIDGFKAYLSEGLFIVPTHTWANVGAENPVYNVRETVPCIGALPTVAVFRPDGVRSLHPTHSVAVFGKRAKEFAAGEEKATSPCPPDGLWARLYEEDAVVLLLGVGLNRNTYIHAVDEMLDLPDRLCDPIPLTIVDYDGKAHHTHFRKHGFTGSANFGNFQKPLEYGGALTTATLGKAQVGVFNVRKGTEIIQNLWKKADYHLCEVEKEIPEEYYK